MKFVFTDQSCRRWLLRGHAASPDRITAAQNRLLGTAQKCTLPRYDATAETGCPKSTGFERALTSAACPLDGGPKLIAGGLECRDHLARARERGLYLWSRQLFLRWIRRHPLPNPLGALSRIAG